MARIIINEGLSPEEVNERRLQRDFQLSYTERMKKAFNLMRLAIMFSKDKQRRKKGIYIKSKGGSV